MQNDGDADADLPGATPTVRCRPVNKNNSEIVSIRVVSRAPNEFFLFFFNITIEAKPSATTTARNIHHRVTHNLYYFICKKKKKHSSASAIKKSLSPTVSQWLCVRLVETKSRHFFLVLPVSFTR